MKNTIAELVPEGCRVYVSFETRDACARFLRQAEEEGFLFTDGEKPTRKHPTDLLAVGDGRTLSYVGIAGRTAFGSGAQTAGGKKLVRVKF